MSNYQRFLSYIYAYEGEEKGENVGFAKVEIRGGQWRLEAKIKGAHGLTFAQVFAVRQEGGAVKKQRLGHMEIKAGEGWFRSQGTDPEACGLLITDGEERAFYTQWRGEECSVPDCLEREREEMPVCEEQPPAPPELVRAAALEEEISRPPRRWRLMQKVCPKMLPAPGYEAWELLEIQLQDIGRLPRRAWIYGNNSFVVQGFFRHGHLLLAAREQDGKWEYRLGVPGEENETEKLLAGLFGFREFMPGNRKRESGFGYWCVEVSMKND